MTYVDAIHNKNTDEIQVVERINGQRIYNNLPAKYVFYYEDPRGTYKTMWGIPCTKYETTDSKKFRKDLQAMQGLGKRIHEHDINPIFRCLSENYLTLPTPDLNIGFFDIEVDFDPQRGYAPTHDPFAPITAISLHLSSTKRLITLVLKPELPQTDKDYLTWEAAEDIVNQFDDTILCNDEEELLKLFLDAIEDADVLSGWNSTGFDIPYVVNRIERVLGKDYSKMMCLWGQRPKKRKYIKFKKEQETYDLVGRVHLDYLELFQKHSSAELHSYKLDHVGEVIVGENKTPYEGTLDALYKRDFKTFIEYNRQDTLLLVKIDAKCRYIELANQLAHTNSVLLQTTMGSVALIEQAIVNETWSLGMQVMSRPERAEFAAYDPGAFVNDDEENEEDEDEESNSAVGAYVADPKKGMHRMIGCVDINSLYPSALRALNMGPETLVGQIRSDRTDQLIAQRVAAQLAGKKKAKGSMTDAWHGLFATLEYSLMSEKAPDRLTVDFVDGDTATVSGKDLHAYIFDSGKPYVVTANGTIFRTDTKAIIPGLLERWYAERKQMQKKQLSFEDLYKGLELTPEMEAEIGPITERHTTNVQFEYDYATLKALIAAGDSSAVREFIVENNLIIKKHFVKAPDETTAWYDTQRAFWGQRQLARKILLNSLYGALLNEGCRFYDKRIGQSVTLSGRSIAKHMNSKVNECITGEYRYDGNGIVYADTDSSYFSAYSTIKADPEMADMADSKDAMLELYLNIGDIVNESFPIYMNEAFNTGLERGQIIAAGLELVAETGMFIKKKRYAVLKFWDETSKRLDLDGKPGKIKAMGLDLKRADTPKFMQDFLSKILLEILTGVGEDDILNEIKEFRNEFRKMEPWEQGTPKKVNGLTGHQERMDTFDINLNKEAFNRRGTEKIKKDPVPGHVRASINWNRLKKANADNYSSDITDGGKVIVCKLLPNPMKLTSVAYPYDQRHLPEWFKKLPFDTELMEETIIDKKVNNLISVLKWDLNKTREDNTFNDLFSFV